MNILLFVTTLIMVMGLLTYAKLQTFISYSAIQTEFDNYMKNVERSAINKQAIWIYDNNTASKKQGLKGDKKTTDSLARLSFSIFIDEKKRQARAQDLGQMTLLTKQLIHILYHDQDFYKEAFKRNQNIVDILLERIYQIAISLPNEKKLTKASDLANLDLGDPELNLFFYKILNGTHTKEELAALEPPTPIAVLVEERGEEDSQDSDDPEEEEYKTPTGYRSLLDFITLKDASKIRIYLAPKELLLAIFGDNETVASIINTRNAIYKAITTGAKPEEASDQFKLRFEGQVPQEYNKQSLDFKVTKTNPKTYE